MRAAFNQTPALCRGVYGIKEAAGAERRCRPASTSHNRIPPVYIQIGAPLGRRFFHHFVTLAFASYNAVCRFSSPSFRPSLPTWDCSHPAFHRRLQSGWFFVLFHKISVTSLGRSTVHPSAIWRTGPSPFTKFRRSIVTGISAAV